MSRFNIIYGSEELSELVKGKPQLIVGVLTYYGLKAVHAPPYIHTTCPVCGTNDCNFRVDNLRWGTQTPFWICYPSRTNGDTPHHKTCHSSILGFIRHHIKRPAEETYRELRDLIHQLDDTTPAYWKKRYDILHTQFMSQRGKSDRHQKWDELANRLANP